MNDQNFRGDYPGEERRTHRVYVTRNSEYHVRSGTCVAVRDRASGQFLRAHSAVQRRLSGSVRYQANGTAIPSNDPPRVGEALYFVDDGRELVTSLCGRIERPEPTVIALYPTATLNSRDVQPLPRFH